MIRARTALATSLTALALTAPAAAAPPRPAAPTTVKLELADAKGGTTQSSTLLIPIDGRGPARVETRSDAGQTVITISRDGRPGTNEPLRFNIERSRNENGRHSDIRVDAAVRLARGKRVVIAHLTRPDGSSTRVTVELR